MAVAPEEFTLAIEEQTEDSQAHVEAHVEAHVVAQEDVRPKRGRPAKRRRGEPEETGQDPAVWNNMTLRSGSKLTQVPVATQTQPPEDSDEEVENLIPCSQNRRGRGVDIEPMTPIRPTPPPPVRRLEMETEEEDAAEDSDDTVDLGEDSQQTQKEARRVKKARRMILQKCNEVLDSESDPSPPPPVTDAQVLVDVLHKLATDKGKEEKVGHHPFYEPMSLQTYDGSEDFQDYLTQFKAIASLKSWSQQQKATILLGRLKGSALSVAATLCDPTYDQLVEHLRSHFGPRHAESYAIQLSAREQHKGESLTEFAHAIRKLTRGAYPDLDAHAQDRLARERFVAGITDTHVRTKLRDLRPQTMPKALEEARILSENKEAEKQRTRRIGWMRSEEPAEEPAATPRQEKATQAAPAIQWPTHQPHQAAPPHVNAPSTDLVAPLQELVRHLQLQPGQQNPYRRPGRPNYKGQQPQRRRPLAPATSTTQCWQCQQYGHYSKDCPVKQAARGVEPQHSQTQTAPPLQPSQPQMRSQQSTQGVPPLIPVPPHSQPQQMNFSVMNQPVPSLPPHQPVMFQPQLQPGSMEFHSMYGGNHGVTQRETSTRAPQPGNGSGQQ